MFAVFVLNFLLFTTIDAQDEQYNLYGETGQAYAIAVNLGNPPQKLNILVDTGSTTLAIASYPRRDGDSYFHAANSSSLFDTRKEVQAKYSQGTWQGHLASELVQFPSVHNVPEVRSDIALITKSHKFFMNGSGWQGLLGLAYLPVGAWGDHVIVESWIDSVDRQLKTPMSFGLKLCGATSVNNATHYGKFWMTDDNTQTNTSLFSYRTPILRQRWYEVGVLSIRVMTPTKIVQGHNITTDSKDGLGDIDKDMCIQLNDEKSIVDSGTTNIRLPDRLFRQVVDELNRTANVLILDDFWYHGEAACWPEPQKWSIPWLAIDLLSADSDYQYFTLEIPPENFMRVVTTQNSSGDSGVVSQYCYKLGLEAGGKETVLGYTAMEGLEVLFNRSASWIGWQPSDCGADTRISGPYNTSKSLYSACRLNPIILDSETSIKAAQWALCAVSIVALGVLIYLLAPCVKMICVKRITNGTQISMSQAALMEPSTS